MTEHSDADDFLESIGLTSSGTSTPEEKFMDKFTEGNNPRILVYRWWLSDEMIKFQYLLEENIKTSRNTMRDARLQDVQLSKQEYGRAMTKFYLQRYHLTRFNGMDGPAADIEVVMDRILAYSYVKETIEKDYT